MSEHAEAVQQTEKDDPNKPDAGYWVECTVEIATLRGPETVMGLTHPRTPGLAVTPDLQQFGLWTVTHIQSGRKVGGSYERCSNACLALVRLAYCCDWTLDAEGIAAYLREHGDEPANAPGCTTTHMGETRPTSKRMLLTSERQHFWFDEFPWETESPQEHANAMLLGLPSPMEMADSV